MTPVRFLLIAFAAWLALAPIAAVVLGGMIARGMGPEGTTLCLYPDAERELDAIEKERAP